MMRRVSFSLGIASCIAACKENHSVLTPHGPVAEQIAALTWLLLGMAAAVAAIVAVTLWLALRGPEYCRNAIAQTRAVVAGGVIFPVIVLSILLFAGVQLSATLSTVEPRNAIRIEVTGEQWWWRVRYGASEERIVESANEVRIPVGQDIVFQLKSADVIHSFWIPSLAGKVDMIPGRSTSLRLAASMPGIYRGICAEYCGGAHAFMALDVIAMPEPEYQAWLQRAATAQAPSTDASRRGETLFARSGCGGCHAIGGTAAKGTIGPNLTTLGARRSVAAGLLPMNEDSLARFIADGQHLKPGNKMPPFRIFSEGELRALTAYLVELK
jgi:cytochrome c oxidase subunit II